MPHVGLWHRLRHGLRQWHRFGSGEEPAALFGMQRATPASLRLLKSRGGARVLRRDCWCCRQRYCARSVWFGGYLGKVRLDSIC
jgi:hypothetical protein